MSMAARTSAAEAGTGESGTGDAGVDGAGGDGAGRAALLRRAETALAAGIDLLDALELFVPAAHAQFALDLLRAEAGA